MSNDAENSALTSQDSIACFYILKYKTVILDFNDISHEYCFNCVFDIW